MIVDQTYSRESNHSIGRVASLIACAVPDRHSDIQLGEPIQGITNRATIGNTWLASDPIGDRHAMIGGLIRVTVG